MRWWASTRIAASPDGWDASVGAITQSDELEQYEKSKSIRKLVSTRVGESRGVIHGVSRTAVSALQCSN